MRPAREDAAQCDHGGLVNTKASAVQKRYMATLNSKTKAMHPGESSSKAFVAKHEEKVALKTVIKVQRMPTKDGQLTK